MTKVEKNEKKQTMRKSINKKTKNNSKKKELIICAFNVFHTNFLIKHICVLKKTILRSLNFSFPGILVVSQFINSIRRWCVYAANIRRPFRFSFLFFFWATPTGVATANQYFFIFLSFFRLFLYIKVLCIFRCVLINNGKTSFKLSRQTLSKPPRLKKNKCVRQNNMIRDCKRKARQSKRKIQK